MKQTWFACGCFWGTEHYIRSFEGVVETLTGYAYGDLAEPSYQQVYTDRADVEKVYEEIQVAYGEPLAVEKEPLTQFSSFCIDYKNTKPKYLRAFDAVW